METINVSVLVLVLAFLIGVLAGALASWTLPRVATWLDGRLDYRALMLGEHDARVARENDLTGVRAQRDEAMASATAWEQKAKRLMAERAAPAAASRAGKKGKRERRAGA